MKFVIFGLSVSSSWGNGHATLWRGLCAALAKRGHSVVFFERDVPYYAATRDLFTLPKGKLILYQDWADVTSNARRELAEADVAMVTSYCPDALPASDLVLESRAEIRCFYDLDAPITLDRLERGEKVDYIGPRGLRDFDATLSYAGGPALTKLQTLLGARAVAPLYGSVDPATHYPVEAGKRYSADLSYLGTCAKDRHARLVSLFVEPAKQMPNRKFVIGGSMYDDTFPWQRNIYLESHVPPVDHPAFYCSSKLNLNVTRQAMADNGYCPSGRLFEAAACGAAILTDNWPGLDMFLRPGVDVLIADSTEDAIAAINRSPEELRRIGRSARERTLEQHTADARAQELEAMMNEFRNSRAEVS